MFDVFLLLFLLLITLAFLSSKTVIGTYQPAYLKTNMFRKNPSTNTLRVIQEQTKSLSFEWKPMKHDSFSYVYLENSAGYFWKTERYIEAGDIGNLPTIGKPCEAITYKAEGYYSGILGYSSLFSTYNIEYERVPRIENVRIQKQSDSSSRITLGREESPSFLSSKTVIGTYQPAYLKTNMFRKNPSTNTLRVIQEQTESLSFEWKPMKHDSFSYVYLKKPAGLLGSTTKYIYAGDIGNLPTIGEPCKSTNYEAIGYYSWYKLKYDFLTYKIEYERVPRIENVRIQKQSDSSSRITLGREESPSSNVLNSSFFEVIGTSSEFAIH
ncbi:hypothetical protein MS3_00011190 [Schistosoma haematobium]|uniref:Uncharacterized protein n=1 Tax=Schistosoma haematobium TaxID=6185 RepID=A0A922IHU1_SCHHA|nr:hypothetical protein MS3_00011190 [Schistosoma haematobium]KAH9579520.1 hypothetical protein MS3_00011190 [Schistosoma haematobium]